MRAASVESAGAAPHQHGVDHPDKALRAGEPAQEVRRQRAAIAIRTLRQHLIGRPRGGDHRVPGEGHRAFPATGQRRGDGDAAIDRREAAIGGGGQEVEERVVHGDA